MFKILSWKRLFPSPPPQQIKFSLTYSTTMLLYICHCWKHIMLVRNLQSWTGDCYTVCLLPGETTIWKKNIPVSINYYLKETYKVKLLLQECVTCKWCYCTIIHNIQMKRPRLYQLRKIRSQILVDFLTIKSVWLSTVLRSTQAVYNLIYCVLF